MATPAASAAASAPLRFRTGRFALAAAATAAPSRSRPAVDDRMIILRDGRVLPARRQGPAAPPRRWPAPPPSARPPLRPSPSSPVAGAGRLGLRRPDKRDQLRDALFRSSLGVARPARAVLGLGDERRRRVAKDVVPVRTAFLRKPDRGLVAAFGVLMSVMIVGVFGHGLGRDQTDMRVHRSQSPKRDHEFRGWRRAARRPNRKMAAPTTGPPIGMSVPDSAVYLIETFDRNITPTETFAAR